MGGALLRAEDPTDDPRVQVLLGLGDPHLRRLLVAAKVLPRCKVPGNLFVDHERDPRRLGDGEGDPVRVVRVACDDLLGLRTIVASPTGEGRV